MSKKRRPSFKNVRSIAYKLQSGLCYYCHQPMWENDVNTFTAKHKIPFKKAMLLKATAEHLIARKEGGIDTSINIVAACKYCNSTRHKSKLALQPEAYKKRVLSRLNQNKWHQIKLINPNMSKALI